MKNKKPVLNVPIKETTTVTRSIHKYINIDDIYIIDLERLYVIL